MVGIDMLDSIRQYGWSVTWFNIRWNLAWNIAKFLIRKPLHLESYDKDLRTGKIIATDR